MIVLDTNVVSELMRASPAVTVTAWAQGQPTEQLYTTSITKAEVLRGIEALPKGKRRDALLIAARRAFEQKLAGRVLAFNSAAAEAYAVLFTERQRGGRPISIFDAQIAAIARARSAKLATRNVADFADCGVEVIDPWRDGG